MKWKRTAMPLRLTKASIQKVMNHYGEALANRRSLITDELMLPASKDILKACHEIALNESSSPYEKNYLRAGYYVLALYQPMKRGDAALVQATCPNLEINQQTSEELYEALLQTLQPACHAETRLGELARCCIAELETANLRLHQYCD